MDSKIRDGIGSHTYTESICAMFTGVSSGFSVALSFLEF
jgi:hypothetical protein